MGDWQADGRSLDDVTADFLRARQRYRQELQGMYRPLGMTDATQAAERPIPQWHSLAEMNQDLQKVRERIPAKPDPVKRKADIETELDIIRGRVPTPPGYIVDPLRTKKLMQELKALNENTYHE